MAAKKTAPDKAAVKARAARIEAPALTAQSEKEAAAARIVAQAERKAEIKASLEARDKALILAGSIQMPQVSDGSPDAWLRVAARADALAKACRAVAGDL